MKRYLFLLIFVVFSAIISIVLSQGPTMSTAELLDYYKFASPEEKQRIDSLYMDLEADMRSSQVKSICGVDFGMSRERALSILRYKFGSPMYNSNDMVITFENVKYAGVDFDAIHFLFQADSRNTYFYFCVFVNNAKNRSEAERINEYYREILSRKYEISEIVDDNGFKNYGGGISPLWDGKWYTFLEALEAGTYLTAVRTDVIEYSDELVRGTGYRYGVRILYGPFEYVKEEF